MSKGWDKANEQKRAIIAVPMLRQINKVIKSEIPADRDATLEQADKLMGAIDLWDRKQ
jgi:hypothetical protein